MVAATEPSFEHGKRGWFLTSYSWDEATGSARFQYTNAAGERREVLRHQPAYVVRGGRR
jgi:hypothetical protein